MSSTRNSRREAYINKARAELQALEARGVVASGNSFSAVLVLSSGPLLSESCEAALKASFDRLGYAPDDWLWMSTSTEEGPLSPELIAEAILCFDPTTVVCADLTAAEAFRESFANDFVALPDLVSALFSEGQLSVIRGMRVLNLGDFENSLLDDQKKQTSWARLKQVPALGEPF